MIKDRNIAQNGLAPLPDAVGMNINHYLQPSDTYSGQVSRLHLREGFDLSVYDITTKQPQEIKAGTDPCVSINIMINGGGLAMIHNKDISKANIAYWASTTYVCVMYEAMHETMHLPANTHLKGIDIRLSFKLFNRLSGAPQFTTLTKHHPWHLSSSHETWIGFQSATQPLLTAANCLVEQVHSNQPNDLVIESRVLEILTTVFNQLERVQHLELNLPDAKQRRLLNNAQQLLLADMAHPWTVCELSKRVGLSEKKLKSGFKQTFGLPVYHYLQQARLDKAKEILETSEASIADISHQIGYANQSHFAYLFKRQFGHSPSQIRRNSKAHPANVVDTNPLKESI